MFARLEVVHVDTPPRGGNIPRHKLQERFDAFLLRQAIESVENITIAQRRGHRQQGDDLAERAERPVIRDDGRGLVRSTRSRRRALLLGTDTTLNMLEDPERRPPTPITEIPREMREHWPAEDFTLDPDNFARNFRSARKGAAPGPSGSEHLRPLLSHPNDVLMLHRMGEQLARGQVPQVVIEAIRVGRMTTLEKLDGGVRLSLGTFCEGWSVAPLPSRSTPSWSDARRFSGAPLRHVLELSVWRTHCRFSQRQSPKRQ